MTVTFAAAVSSTTCLPCQTGVSAGAVQALTNTAPAPDVAVAVTPGQASTSAWSGVIGVEGQATGDGRMIELNALKWENLPLPLRYTPTDVGAHDGAVVVGTIDSVSRGANGAINATGTFDLEAAYGPEAARVVGNGTQDGVSMDLDDVSFEVRVKSELMNNGMDDLLGMLLGEPAAPTPPGPDGRVVVAEMGADDELMVTTAARIRAATIVSIPAFDTARIALSSGTQALSVPPDTNATPPAPPKGKNPPAKDTAPAAGSVGVAPDGSDCSCDQNDPNYNPDCDCSTPPSTNPPASPAAPSPGNAASVVTAAAAPLAPPVAWFSRPSLREPTALTLTPDGQVFGHLAAWNSCHISHTHSGCVQPPHSAAGYAYFHVGSVLTKEGAEVPVGHITLDTRHAGETLSPANASAHYENTGTVVADVAAGEDEFGIWVAGALRPNVTETQVRALRSAPLSGDWRRVSGNLELVAALAVNVPGFPIPRPSGLVASGVAQTLLASGMLPPRTVRRPGTEGALSIDDLRYLKRLVARERAEDQRAALEALPSAVQLARRVRASSLALRAHRALTAPVTEPKD